MKLQKTLKNTCFCNKINKNLKFCLNFRCFSYKKHRFFNKKQAPCKPQSIEQRAAKQRRKQFIACFWIFEKDASLSCVKHPRTWNFGNFHHLEKLVFITKIVFLLYFSQKNHSPTTGFGAKSCPGSSPGVRFGVWTSEAMSWGQWISLISISAH